jgi:hypothetical protein
VGLIRTSVRLAVVAASTSLALLVGGFVGLTVLNGGPASADVRPAANLRPCPASAPVDPAPGFVPAFATNGQGDYATGYVRAGDLAASRTSSHPEYTPVFCGDGRTAIGGLALSGPR